MPKSHEDTHIRKLFGTVIAPVQAALMNIPETWRQFARAFCLAMIMTSAASAQDNTADRTFLIVGEPNAAAWEMLIGAPADREATMSGAIGRLGGEMLSYYWGLGDGKNYITIRMPDDPGLIQALYVTRLGDNLLSSYQMIELISSADMTNALARVPEVKAVDDQ